MIKTLSTLAIAATAALTPLSASATQVHRGGHIGGWDVVVIFEGETRTDVDTIVIEGPAGREEIELTCRPFDWRSWGPNSAAWVDRIVTDWCW